MTSRPTAPPATAPPGPLVLRRNGRIRLLPRLAAPTRAWAALSAGSLSPQLRTLTVAARDPTAPSATGIDFALTGLKLGGWIMTALLLAGLTGFLLQG